mmetsp:Transcript_7184/g.17258  ORF Transcript_7184/g.17258 Transcript_7184/m.17258 type:complete len:221 (-) Transcript_7184:54-716(-)
MVVGLLSAAVDFILPLGTTHGARRLLAPLRRAPHARAIYSASVGADVLVSLDVGEESAPVHVRRKRYSNTYPKKFEDKYKEHRGDAETILKVLCKGSTPAGQHVPIMPAEIMERLSLASRMAASAGELVVVDCTVGYGGHSSEILAEMMRAQSRLGQSGGSLAPRARLVCLDQVRSILCNEPLLQGCNTSTLPHVCFCAAVTPRHCCAQDVTELRKTEHK